MKALKTMLVMALAILLLATPVFAQGRHGTKNSQPQESTGILTDQDGNTMDYAVWIYSISIFADEASSYAGVYDCDTTAELISSSTKARYEIGEATQYDTATKVYAKPQYYSDGVGAIIYTGVFSVEYGPEPTN